ncbi:MAG: copper chaperone PCu(A)C [Candidimonas sp.]|jgi:copper(I)-binding protein
MKSYLTSLALACAAMAPLSVSACPGHDHDHADHAHHEHKSHAKAAFGDAATAAAPAGVAISACWIRAMPNRLPSAGYFKIHNGGAHDAVLIGAQSKAFSKVMLHATQTSDGMTTMVHADKVELPAGANFEFAPGGHHVMLEQPTAELPIGKTLPISFWFEGGRALTVDCEVRSPSTVK